MPNATWVCFDCRLSVRRDPYEVREVTCPHCGAGCQNLGPKLRVPAKRDAAGWRRLQDDIVTRAKWAEEYRQKSEVRKQHDLEHRIEELEERRENPARTWLIRDLTRTLDR